MGVDRDGLSAAGSVRLFWLNSGVVPLWVGSGVRSHAYSFFGKSLGNLKINSKAGSIGTGVYTLSKWDHQIF